MPRAITPSQADPVAPTSFPANPPRRSPMAPVLVWLLLQLLALGLSAGRVPFYATKSFPQPAELLAMPLMCVVQFGASAMLFPYLLRDARAAGFAIAASGPFTILAGILTGLPQGWETMASAAFIAVWLAGLALWTRVLRSSRAQAIGVCIATLFTFGGPLLKFLRLEYGVHAMDSVAGIEGPISAALFISEHDPLSRTLWTYAGIYLVIACIVFGIGLFRNRPTHWQRS